MGHSMSAKDSSPLSDEELAAFLQEIGVHPKEHGEGKTMEKPSSLHALLPVLFPETPPVKSDLLKKFLLVFTALLSLGALQTFFFFPLYKEISLLRTSVEHAKMEIVLLKEEIKSLRDQTTPPPPLPPSTTLTLPQEIIEMVEPNLQAPFQSA